MVPDRVAVLIRRSRVIHRLPIDVGLPYLWDAGRRWGTLSPGGESHDKSESCLPMPSKAL